MRVITLTTDFGNKDWFVGAMKGVILSASSRNRVVDITHEIPPGDILAGAFALASSFECFPPGTVHLAVVDPGVGSRRAAIAVRTEHFMFVGPDNGILSLALTREKIDSIYRIENEKLFFHPISETFHGRDIFAPIAARIARDCPIEEVGPEVNQYVRLGWPATDESDGRLAGEVIYLDHFGNAITNISREMLERARPAYRSARLPDGKELPLRSHYQQTEPGAGLALIGSTDYLEISINGGHAAASYNLNVGDPVTLIA